MSDKKYRVWKCKLVVRGDSELPNGFDHPPRMAAIQAVLKHFDVLACFSGWGGELTEGEIEVMGDDVSYRREPDPVDSPSREPGEKPRDFADDAADAAYTSEESPHPKAVK